MHLKPSREDLIELTKLNPFDRFSDGRPRVPDDLLARMKEVTTEEAWGVLRAHGFHRQFEGNWLQTHPGRITVGRAVTAQFVLDHPRALDDRVRAEDRGLRLADHGRPVEGIGSIEVIQARYRKLAVQYHPDKLASSATELQDLAGERLREINGAYSELMKSRGER